MSAISFKTLIAVSWAFTGLAILLSAGRFWIRCKIIKRLSWDDAAHLLGLLILVAQVSIVTWSASITYQIVNYDTVDDTRLKIGNLLCLEVAGVLVTSVLTTWLCLYAIKLSFLLLYHRIFQISQKFIRAWWIVLGIVFLTFCVVIAGSLTQCGSPSDLDNVGMFYRQSIA